MRRLLSNNRSRCGAALGLGLALVFVSCGNQDPRPPIDPIDPSGPYFDPNHIVEVAVEMAPNDYETMRFQTRTWLDVVAAPNKACMTQPVRSPFTDYHASVTIDGQRFADVGIHKKGFLGSLDPNKPSLRLKLDQWVPGQTLGGLNRFVLNSSVQDRSYVKQCLGYGLFEKAGVPVPRCNFAHVTLNGQDLGLYVHVEGTDKRFLRRRFQNENGDLWKGIFADFRVPWLNMFDLLTNEPEDPDPNAVDRTRLAELTDAMQDVSDVGMYSKAEKVIDVDQFITLWAMEVILEHWDGYANNNNNLILYDNPETGKFVFMPWDLDQILIPDPFQKPLPPASVYANSALARRFYLYAPTRERYVARLRELLDTVFHEDEIVAEIDRLQALIVPLLGAQPQGAGAVLEEIEKIRQYIRTRRAVLLVDLAKGPHQFTRQLKATPCVDLAGKAEGTFSTRYGTNGTNRWGAGTLKVTFRDREIPFGWVGAQAGRDQNDPNQTWPVINMSAAGTDGRSYNLWIGVQPELFRDGAAPRLDQGEAWGGMGVWDPFIRVWTFMGSYGTGPVALTRAAAVDGAPVEGSFNTWMILWD